MHDAPRFSSLLLSTVSRPRIAPANERETSEEQVDDQIIGEIDIGNARVCGAPHASEAQRRDNLKFISRDGGIVGRMKS